MNTLINELAVVAQRSTIVDSHVRLGRQCEIAVLQHELNEMDKEEEDDDGDKCWCHRKKHPHRE